MKSKAKRATKAERDRMAKIKQMPCVACSQALFPWPQFNNTEVHHLLSGNKRLGHLFTIPLCQWHHEGIPNTSRPWSPLICEDMAGPSQKLTSKKFHAVFGTDEELLMRTNELLEKPNDSL